MSEAAPVAEKPLVQEEALMRKVVLSLVLVLGTLAGVAMLPTKADARPWWRRGYYRGYYPGYVYGYPAYYGSYYYAPAYGSYYYTPAYRSYSYTPAYATYYYPAPAARSSMQASEYSAMASDQMVSGWTFRNSRAAS